MNAKPKTELNRCVFVQKRNSVNGALISLDTYNNCIKFGVRKSHANCELRNPKEAEMCLEWLTIGINI